MENKNTHGGRRKGSGRKPRPKPEYINLRVTPELKKLIEEESKKDNVSINKWLVKAAIDCINKKNRTP